MPYTLAYEVEIHERQVASIALLFPDGIMPVYKYTLLSVSPDIAKQFTCIASML